MQLYLNPISSYTQKVLIALYEKRPSYARAIEKALPILKQLGLA